MKKISKNYKICRRRFVYDSTYRSVAENFEEYILSLNINETDEIENDIKVNGWGLTSLKDHKYSFELLRSFDIFNYSKWKASIQKWTSFCTRW